MTQLSNGTIVVTIGGKVADLRLSQKDITMAPLNSSNAVMTEIDMGTSVRRWRCGSAADGTDLSPSFLPASCRGG